MFQVGDIVNIKELYSKMTWYNSDIFIIKQIIGGDYVQLGNKTTEFVIWDEYIEINPINARKQKIKKLKERICSK